MTPTAIAFRLTTTMRPPATARTETTAKNLERLRNVHTRTSQPLTRHARFCSVSRVQSSLVFRSEDALTYNHIGHQYNIWHFVRSVQKMAKIVKKRHCFSCWVHSVRHKSHLELSGTPWQCHAAEGQISFFSPAYNQYALMVVPEHSTQL